MNVIISLRQSSWRCLYNLPNNYKVPKGPKMIVVQGTSYTVSIFVCFWTIWRLQTFWPSIPKYFSVYFLRAKIFSYSHNIITNFKKIDTVTIIYSIAHILIFSIIPINVF